MKDRKRVSLDYLLEHEGSEFILNPENRHLAFKVSDNELWDLYNRQFECFWQPKEIDPTRDRGWESLTESERKFISMVLAFFATADSIVYDNIDMNFSSEVKITEAKFFYGMQSFMENIHSQVYMSLLTTYVKDEDEQARLINAIEDIETIKKKGEWAKKYFSRKIPFAMRIIAFSIVEGIYFSSAFASIFWLKKYKKGILESLTLSNSFIARDEGLHTEFAVALFKRLERIPLEKDVHECFAEAVDLEINFVNEILNVSVIGMDSSSLCNYVKFVADRLLLQLGYKPLYNSTNNPLIFMETQSMRVTTNFFEAKVHEYSLATSGDYSEDTEF
jgi:ribonucleotide reductase beta subunit family protein with ferritin-like domain